MRVILITGSNGGLGLAIAKIFLAESEENFVWLGIRSRREKADEIVSSHSGRAACVELDVTQPESWKLAVEKIVQTHARLDVLVNNAGRHQDGLLATLPRAAWDDV